ncbi:MAG: sortase [Candidatus Yanofskybacteria bacterium]|nr:sortase [Candidatus Yanofskybacteria bacterium]
MVNTTRTRQIIFATVLVVGGLMAAHANYLIAELKYWIDKPEVSAEKMEPDTLVIESLGIKVPIVYVEESNEDAFQEGLINGVVHYPGTADIGKPGNPFIFGHSSDYIWSKGKYKTIFAVLPKIASDAEIKASDHQGRVYRYKVTKTLVASPNDTKLLDQQDFKEKLLTIQTSYPVGTALKRFIVVAQML